MHNDGDTDVKSEVDTHDTSPLPDPSLDNYKRLLRCYFEEYRPTEWTLKNYETDVRPQMNKTRVFYDNSMDKLRLVRILTEREPTHFSMCRHYNTMVLKDNFGYTTSAVENGCNSSKQHPAVYCYTPIRSHINGNLSTPAKKVHIINLAALSFDNDTHPDYTQYIENNDIKLGEIQVYYRNMWMYAFCAANYLRLPSIAVCVIGESSWPFGAFEQRVHTPCIAECRTKYPQIQVVSAPTKIPEDVLAMTQSQLDNVLFVNAWNKHSMVGNGNAGDHTVCGEWGKSTAIAALCWPKSNPRLRFQPIW